MWNVVFKSLFGNARLENGDARNITLVLWLWKFIWRLISICNIVAQFRKEFDDV